MTLPEQSRYIAAQWKTVTDKSKYIEQSKKDRARYDDEMSRYVPPHKIVRPRSSYAFFMKDARARISKEHPDKNPRELMPFIAQAWKNISESEKQKYIDMAKEDKARYAQEKAAAPAPIGEGSSCKPALGQPLFYGGSLDRTGWWSHLF